MTAPLSVDEERSLYPLIQQGRRASRLLLVALRRTTRNVDVCCVNATRVKRPRSTLLRATLGLVRTRVVERGYRFGNDELEAAGVEALVNALRRFDPEQGNRFSTYANYWIMKLVNQSVQQQAGLSDSEMRSILKLQKLIRANPTKHLTKRDVAQALGISQAKAHETMQLNRELQSRRFGTTELDEDDDFRMRREVTRPSIVGHRGVASDLRRRLRCILAIHVSNDVGRRDRAARTDFAPGDDEAHRTVSTTRARKSRGRASPRMVCSSVAYKCGC